MTMPADDEIVREIPVYLNRLPEDTDCSMYVLQYPLRPVYRPYGDHGQLTLIEAGEDTQKLRLTYGLNVEGGQFDPGKRALVNSMLALKADNKLNAKDEAELDAIRLHKMSSSMAQNDELSDYAVACMRRGNLYVTPVSKVLQFRPDLSHLDDLAALAKKRGEELGDKMQASPAAAVVSTGDASTTNVAVEETALVNSRVKLTHVQERDKDLREKYKAVDVFYDADSPEAAEITNMLMTYPQRYRAHIETAPSGAEFIDLLGTSADTDVAMVGASKDAGSSYEIRTRRLIMDEQERDFTKFCVPPTIRCDNSHMSYLQELTKNCALSTLSGTRADVAVSTEAAGTGVGVGPLSFLALSKLTPKQQVGRIMKLRQVESFKEIKNLMASRSITDKELIQFLLDVAITLHGNWIAKSDHVYESEIRDRQTDLEILTRDLILCLYSKNRVVDRTQIRRMTNCPPDRLSTILNSLYTSKDGKFVPKLAPDVQFKNAYETLCNRHEDEWSPAKAQQIVLAIKNFNEREAQRVKQSTVSQSGADIIDVLELDRVKRHCERVLREHGASAEAFIVDEVIKSLTKDIQTEMQAKLVAELGSTDIKYRQQLLDQNNKMKIALKELSVTDLRIVLSQCAENFQNLWIVNSTGNSHMDVYRKFILKLYRENPEKGITKNDFKQAYQQHFKKQTDLPDMQFRALFKEVAVNISGYWHYKGSQVVQKSTEE